MRNEISLSKTIGKGYNKFWNSQKRYVVCKGSRGSKKSKTTALWHIVKLMQYPLANALVVRKVERTLRDSCFSDLKWAIHKLGVDAYWKATTSPMELTYTPTGQKIIFRGLDDPLKITSISVPVGFINFVWIEEAYEINKESDFDMLDESVRGELPDGYFKRITVTFNPWNERHWLKARFFDNPSEDTLSMTTTYQCNEWLDESDLKLFEEMKKRNPRRYQVAGLGNWGVTEGVVYENWEEVVFTFDEIKMLDTAFGLDFGYTVDETALPYAFIDLKNSIIYIWDELYERGLSNKAIYQKIYEAGYSKDEITADSAEPKSIDELRSLGLRRIKGAKKGRDSINAGIQFIQNFKIKIHPRCTNFLTEISNYTWDKDKFGNRVNRPIDEFNHLMDALRYGCEKYMINKKWLI